MDDVIRIDDKWYVLATSSRADDRTRVLKHGETFGLFDRHGDIQHIGIGEQGLYNNGTRFLSQFELSVNQRRPLLLNSTVKKDNSIMTVDLTTPDLYQDGKEIIAKGMLHIFRCKLLWQDVHYEHIRVHNYSDRPLDFCLQIKVDSDYNDIFQVRGAHRPCSGEMLTTTYTENELCLATLVWIMLHAILDFFSVYRFKPMMEPMSGFLCLSIHIRNRICILVLPVTLESKKLKQAIFMMPL